jgi:hypothetical protein
MRYIFFFLLLLKSISCYSQFYVGDSKEEAESILQRGEINFTQAKLSDTTNRVAWFTEDSIYEEILVLNNNNIVTKQTIVQGKDNPNFTINELVKWFNKDFVTISPTEWRDYDKGRIYKIQLDYLLDQPLFTITLIPHSIFLSRCLRGI